MIIILFVIFILLFIAIFDNLIFLRTRRVNFGGDVRILHIADLHRKKFGRMNNRLIQRVSVEKPDIILISGDLISRKCTDFSLAEHTLRELNKIAPVYMVFGNHEQDCTERFGYDVAGIFKNTGIRLLENERETIEIRGRKINICGLVLNHGVYRKNHSYRNLDNLEVSEIVGKIGEKPSGETILLVHNPKFAEQYSEWGADYAVCGHVHGGVVRIPFTKIGLLSPERKLMPKYCFGVYKIGSMKLLVSGGLGKLRYCNPSEIVVYSL